MGFSPESRGAAGAHWRFRNLRFWTAASHRRFDRLNMLPDNDQSSRLD